MRLITYVSPYKCGHLFSSHSVCCYFSYFFSAPLSSHTAPLCLHSILLRRLMIDLFKIPGQIQHWVAFSLHNPSLFTSPSMRDFSEWMDIELWERFWWFLKAGQWYLDSKCMVIRLIDHLIVELYYQASQQSLVMMISYDINDKSFDI